MTYGRNLLGSFCRMIEEPDIVAALRAALQDAERARAAADDRFEALQAAHRQERHETQHRLRNTAAVIRAILHRTIEETDDVSDYCGLLDGRLTTYLNIQAAVAVDPTRGIDLELLIRDEMLKFGISDGERFAIAGPTLELNASAAGLISLTIYELISQMIVDGFEWSSAHLTIGWALEGTDHGEIVIDWAVSQAQSSEDRQTAWSDSLHAAMEHQLSGRISTTHNDGSTVTKIVLPRTACIFATSSVRETASSR